jgi:hypothetical protein
MYRWNTVDGLNHPSLYSIGQWCELLINTVARFMDGPEQIVASGISADALLSNLSDDYPELKFPVGFQLECLHGRHRLQARRETLPSRDKWWTVDLYLEGMSISNE